MISTLANPVTDNWLPTDLAQGGFVWDSGISRYRDKSNGRLIAERDIISGIELFNTDVIKPNVNSITERFINGSIDLPTWQQQMARELKDGWLINSMAGRGGKNAMTPADYGRAGGRLAYEYRKLNEFAQRIKAGTLTPAQIRANAALYAAAPRTGYWDGQTAAMIAADYVAEQRFLGDTDHCETCIELANRGRQPIGSLPEPGTVCEGKRRCGCTKRYFKDFEDGNG
jgi:hypothetical protein